MKTKKYLSLFLAMLMVLSLLAACGQKPAGNQGEDPGTNEPEVFTQDTSVFLTEKPASTRPTDDSKIDHDARVIYNLGWGAPRNYQNPYYMPGSDFMRHIFCSPLVMFAAAPDGTKTMEYVLAENVECSADMTEFTITLRDGIKWHDGEPITAHDVVYSATVLWYDDSFMYSMYYGREEQPGVWTEVDERTVNVKYEEPYSTFLTYLDEKLVIAPAHIFEGITGEDLNTFAFDGMPVGSGPFKMVDYNEGEYILLERFDDYYEPALIKELRLQFLTEDSVAVLAMQSHEIDITRTWDAITNALDATDGVTVYRVPETRVDILLFNISDAMPYSDPYVRKAYTCLINTDEIAANVLGNMQVAYHNIYYKNSEVFDPTLNFESLNIEQAKAYLEEGGYTLGDDGYYQKDGKRLELDFNHTQGPGSDREKIGLTLQHNAKQAGIYMTVNNYDDTSWDEKSEKGTWDVIIDYVGEGETAAECTADFGYLCESERGDLYFGEYKEDIIALCDAVKAARDSGDNATAIAKAKELAQFMRDNALCVPMGGYVTAYNTQNNVHIEDCCYDELQYLNRIWVEKAN